MRPADWEDVIQETWLAAWLHFPSLRDPNAFGAWLTTTCRRRAWQSSREARRALEVIDYVARVNSDGSEHAAEELREELIAAICELPPRQRLAVQHRFFSDMSVSQAASQMGCRPGTVKALQHQAIRTLRMSLEVIS